MGVLFLVAIKGIGDRYKRLCLTRIDQIHHLLLLKNHDMLARSQHSRRIEENSKLGLSIDNLSVTTYYLWMRTTICREDGTQKRPWKMQFGTPRIMVGVSKLVAPMPGAGFTAPTTTQNVVAENSALQVFGAHRRTPQITASKYGELSTIVPPGKTIEPGIPT